MEILNHLNSSLLVFLIAWSRLLGLFLLAPVFSFPLIIMRIRILLAFTIALCIVPWLNDYAAIHSSHTHPLEILVILIKEFSVGAVIGIFLSIVFASLRLCAQFFSIQIGMGIAEIFDSLTNENGSLWGYLFYIIGALIFIELGGMHILLKAITESYELIPAYDFLKNGEQLFGKSVQYFSQMFLIALKIAFPVITTALILSISLGVIGKMAPQANIFILGIPLQMGLGILFILITIPFMVVVFANIVTGSIQNIMNFLIADYFVEHVNWKLA